ncbi:MAG: exodeoxyribonuclease VII small subunit [Clostridiales bacterium]|jgi:exodeoxyribonuclease VII small subunit|nr:exodeoxyribonuclease VII small subunit [Clostridiales bacterium]
MARFEEKVDELETIVRELETGALSVEAGVALFEKGVAVTKECLTALNAGKDRISAVKAEMERLFQGDESEE